MRTGLCLGGPGAARDGTTLSHVGPVLKLTWVNEDSSSASAARACVSGVPRAVSRLSNGQVSRWAAPCAPAAVRGDLDAVHAAGRRYSFAWDGRDFSVRVMCGGTEHPSALSRGGRPASTGPPGGSGGPGGCDVASDRAGPVAGGWGRHRTGGGSGPCVGERLRAPVYAATVRCRRGRVRKSTVRGDGGGGPVGVLPKRGLRAGEGRAGSVGRAGSFGAGADRPPWHRADG